MVNNNPPKMTKSVARATEVIRALSEKYENKSLKN